MNTIVCVDNNWGIGRNNDLLFHLPADMKYFREKTTGHTVIMGLATLFSFPGRKPLKNRTNIVISGDPDFKAEGMTVCYSIEECLEAVKDTDPAEVFVIGGASIYEQMLPYCDTAYVTKVNASEQAEKYFPNLDSLPEWYLDSESETQTDGGLEFRFTVYRKK
ncbi:MAG: dihydrofolate reductase [Clostridia bacterium]|nr:dihydrofolate reductase [Clostridia bacterium]